MSWAKAVAGGVELSVLVQPRASRTKVVGEHDGRLKIALSAPPVDGEANAALIEFLSDELGTKKAAVELIEGDTSRRKRVRVTGVELDAVLKLAS
ncbi:MAG: YggU family protein [Archangiaceae bacterium]|nr:YggU family protein [Archangiaceae bacterium]